MARKLIIAAIACTALALWLTPARATHTLGCDAPLPFKIGQAGTFAGFANVCTPAGNVYFYGNFGSTPTDFANWCGYIVAQTPVGYAGLAGDMKGTIGVAPLKPNPIPLYGLGTWSGTTGHCS